MASKKLRSAASGSDEELQVDMEQILPFSSKTGEGRDDLLDSIEALLEG